MAAPTMPPPLDVGVTYLLGAPLFVQAAVKFNISPLPLFFLLATERLLAGETFSASSRCVFDSVFGPQCLAQLGCLSQPPPNPFIGG